MVDIPTWLFPVIAFLFVVIVGRVGTVLKDYIQQRQLH
ncbi:hypothetical protein QE380_001668 [Acinetobacter baylyi]|uniref:Uncharacterized protein n=1 Tax=Acinetobacter baylyi TaxID=202950 RepID=A0ABU0UVZ4_ACIBI|nr:hypothetical protein F952_00874 [Acinetobacter baylyi DSM 14961 = CIP 107474]MDQ1208745.1 hypothetical protein [Acinetobacter baylyi]MDR6107664.1 hypothetical protein [Acinetobacter baylyi]MDR6185616.1 hypothetical protein [Acinetobacter baylyi]